MSVTVNVEKRQGSTMGTVIARVGDPGNAVAEVVFYVQVQGAAETGPYPPDIVRREPGHLYQGTYHGVYEKDVVLDALYGTSVRAVALLVDGSSVAGATQSFGVRTAVPGSAVRVQDADTAAAIVETLSFQGSVVQVQNGVAVLDLDSRYAHAHPYLPLAGGGMTGRLVVSMNTSNPSYGTGHAEFLTWDGSPAALGFHRSGYTAVTLRHAAAGALELLDNTGAWGQYQGGSFWARGGRFYGVGANLHIDGTAASFVTQYGGALQGRFQSLLLSDSFADASRVPSLGLWAKGGVIGGNLELGRTPYSGTLRNPTGALHLQYEAGAVAIGNPASLAQKLNVQGSVLIESGSLLVNGGNLNMNPGQASYFGSGGEVGRIYFGGEPANYYVGKSAAGTSLNGGYAQLQLAYHTGVQVGAQARYGGVRFYSSEHFVDDGAPVAGSIPRRKVFSVAEGDNDVRVTHNLRVGGDIFDSYGNAVPAVIVAGSAPATARPGTLWIQV